MDSDPNLTYQIGLTGDVLRKLYFNMRRWPMNYIRFRKAFAMGVDWKNASINAFAFNSGNHARTLLEYTKYFNPEEAKKLVDAVIKDAGKKIPPVFWLDGDHAQGKIVGEIAKSQLEPIGIPINLQFLSTALYATKILRDPKMEWDISSFDAGFGLEPSLGFTYFVTKSGSAPDGESLGAYSNPDFDDFVKRAEVAGEAEAIKLYQEAEKILLKEIATIPLFPNRHVIAYNKKVKDVTVIDSLNIPVTTPFSNIWIDR